MNSHELIEKDCPLVYDISVDSNSLWISVGPEVADAVETVFIQALTMNKNDRFKSRVTGLAQELDLPVFVTPFSKAWGFGEVIRTEEDHRNIKSITWKFVFPARRSFTENRIDEFHKQLLCISASLQLLFRVLNTIDPPKGEEKKQFVMVNGLMTQLGQNGGALSIVFSKALCEWYKRQNGHFQGIKTGIGAMMRVAYKKMTRDGIDYNLDQFLVRMDEGSKTLMLSCPGNACGLTPDDRTNDDTDEGYELVSHNVDGPIQQLTLLVGIAQFLQEVRSFQHAQCVS